MHHSKEIKEVFRELNSNNEGLSQAEAEKRLQEYGLNEIREAKKISPIKIFLEQFNSVVVYILIAALIISLFIGERLDAIVIGIILILNAVFGFIQEYRAEKSIEVLKKLASLKATVMRDGKEKDIDAKLLVPGDILKLETGDKIPADARLFEVINLETQEASLTGESTPVSKELKLLPEKTPLADRINMVFSGTVITNGRGKAVVTGTGMKSEIGKIAELIEEVEQEKTPLQKKLEQMGRVLGIATVVVSFIVFLTGIFKGGGVFEFFIVAVALAVAAIHEGFLGVVLIGFGLGSLNMFKN